ncbi:MAG: hypothetical protein JKX99_10700 [Robiginitomaculum sp.]|nr:hypothetical protein [Robiginitomaculum sp.]
MIVSLLFGRKKRRKMGDQLYSFIAQAARDINFFGAHKIPDTVDGRFEVLVIHAFLTMQALRVAGPKQRLDQLVFDAMFRDLDSALREMGTSDTRVGKQIKAMAKAFYGRSEKYHEAIETGDLDQIRQAIERNALASMPAPPAPPFVAELADWLLRSKTTLAKQTLDEITEFGPAFAKPKFSSTM